MENQKAGVTEAKLNMKMREPNGERNRQIKTKIREVRLRCLLQKETDMCVKSMQPIIVLLPPRIILAVHLSHVFVTLHDKNYASIFIFAGPSKH